jgi:tRNA threonylcarbamoyladenosine biosynthesis protein TsaE
MVTFTSHSPAETQALGEEWGRHASSGLVIGLSGDLGAGKTQLVKGLARGLGFAGRVHSPSFGLVNEYSGGRFPLFHLDLYRLETAQQIFGAGLDEYLEPPGISVIEWVERWFDPASPGTTLPRGLLPRLYRSVRLETISESVRRIQYEDFGA